MNHAFGIAKHNLGRFSVAALIVVAFSYIAASSSPALAQFERSASAVSQGPQISAAVTELSRSRFQQYVFSSCLPAQSDQCFLNFAKVPASSRLDISNVSCYFYTQIPMRVAQLLVIDSQNKIQTASTLQASRLPGVSPETETDYVANHAVSVFANAGQHFQIFFNGNRPGFVSLFGEIKFIGCHISGDLVKLG
jgi:hypothetical protein